MITPSNIDNVRTTLLGIKPQNFPSGEIAMILDIMSTNENITQMYLALGKVNENLKKKIKEINARNRQLEREKQMLQNELLKAKQAQTLKNKSKREKPLSPPLVQVAFPKEKNRAIEGKEDERVNEESENSGDEADYSDSDAFVRNPKKPFLAIVDTP